MPIELTTISIGMYLLLGLGAGIGSGLFGVGSGIVVIPALTLLASIPQKEAQGTALAIMVPMALMGAIRYHLNPEIHLDFKLILILMIAVVIGANVGATMAGRLSNRALQMGFACFLLIVAVKMLWSSFKPIQ